MPIFDPDGKCPLLNKKCIKHQCVWYNMLQGNHPQTGQNIQEWGCSIAWIPLLLVENSKHSMATTAATESFRNEMVKGNDALMELSKEAIKQKTPMNGISTLMGMIGNHQRALADKDPNMEDESVRQLSNNKIKVKKRTKSKKVKKNGSSK